MFIREVKTTNKKTGVTYSKYQLVESYRSEKGPRQRILMTLTELDLEKALWPALANAISERLSGSESLFESDPIISRYADLVMTKYQVRSDVKGAREQRASQSEFEMIDLASATTTLNRSLGPELVGSEFYQSLRFSEILSDANLSSEQLAISKAVILARLIHPGSDRKSYNWILNNSSLAEMCGINLEKFHKDKVYEIADVLYRVKDLIEPALFRSAAELFPSERRLFLFDLTNTYFEGNTKGNTLAKYGHSKEKRYDATLVSLALLVDDRGLPVYSEIYEGNCSEPRTLSDVLDHLGQLDQQSLFDEFPPTIVMDRGIATKENVGLLISRGLNYVVIERANKKTLYKEHFIEMEGFSEITDSSGSQVLVKKITGGNNTPGNSNIGNNTVVLCRSMGRKNKEEAIANQATQRFFGELELLRASIKRSGISKTQAVSERIGRIKSKYPGVWPKYDITLLYHENHGKIINKRRFDKVIDLLVEEKPSKLTKDQLAGTYVIDTSHNELTEAEIWSIYTTLTKVEDAFRALKSDLGLRPIYHQLARRTAAHLFISVLAYHILCAIELSLRQQGDKRRWSTINEELSTHMRTTMVLSNEKGIVYHLRHSGAPESNQKEIYRLLGIKDTLPRIKTIATHL